MSRSFGDLPYRAVGLIAEPDIGWHELAPEDESLILATDGVFEALSEEQVCQIAAATASGAPLYVLRRHILSRSTLWVILCPKGWQVARKLQGNMCMQAQNIP